MVCLVAAWGKGLYMSPALCIGIRRYICALRLAVQDIALSRRKHGFDSRRARQKNQAFPQYRLQRVQLVSNIRRSTFASRTLPFARKSKTRKNSKTRFAANIAQLPEAIAEALRVVEAT